MDAYKTLPAWVPLSRPVACWGTIWAPRRARGDGLLAAADEERARVALARQWGRGRLAWHLRYLLSRRFRWDEERAGWLAAIERRLLGGGEVGPEQMDRIARRIADRLFFGVADLAEARRFVARAVREARRRIDARGDGS